MRWTTDEDVEDYEQERAIREWLSRENKSDDFNFTAITRNNTVKRTNLRAAFSLDQKLSIDGEDTFYEVVAGDDGRELYQANEIRPEEYIDAYLSCMGFNEEDTEWLIATLKLSERASRSRFEKFLIDLEW